MSVLSRIQALRKQAASVFFTDRDIILPANNKTRIYKIGDYVLPLQPLCEIRKGRNWVLTDVEGSASNPTLSGTTVKENMGLADAVITFSGILLTTGKTMTQSIGLTGGAEDEDVHWADKIAKLEALFNEAGALPIFDWAPGQNNEELPSDATPEDISDPRIRETGRSMFEEQGIEYVTAMTINIAEKAGADGKVYTLRLQQDRPITLEEIMPIEEVETAGDVYA